MRHNEATRDFILAHRGEDVRQLAFSSKKYPGVDMFFALDQISGWQKAQEKLPEWSQNDRIVYPQRLSMEQCSSEQTALYKAQLVRRLLGDPGNARKNKCSFADLTGGFGVDFYFIARELSSMKPGEKSDFVYVERQQQLCGIARNNFDVLGLSAAISCADATAYLKTMNPVDLIFLDPARRSGAGKRVCSIADSTPNVLEIKQTLLEKSQFVLLKLSPMYDWQQAIRELDHVAEVHIVSVKNECKELLILLSAQPGSAVRVCCVNDNAVFEFENHESGESVLPLLDGEIPLQAFLYEPNASIMKAGCFAELCGKYPLQAISSNSHLFVSREYMADFPGRKFEILQTSTLNKKDVREKLRSIHQANVTTRNFPLTSKELRRRLKWQEGGDDYVFATTARNNEHLLVLCRKVGL